MADNMEEDYYGQGDEKELAEFGASPVTMRGMGERKKKPTKNLDKLDSQARKAGVIQNENEFLRQDLSRRAAERERGTWYNVERAEENAKIMGYKFDVSAYDNALSYINAYAKDSWSRRLWETYNASGTKPLSEDEFKSHPLYREGMRYSQGMTEGRLQYMNATNNVDLIHEEVRKNNSFLQGVWGNAVGFIAGSFLDTAAITGVAVTGGAALGAAGAGAVTALNATARGAKVVQGISNLKNSAQLAAELIKTSALARPALSSAGTVGLKIAEYSIKNKGARLALNTLKDVAKFSTPLAISNAAIGAAIAPLGYSQYAYDIGIEDELLTPGQAAWKELKAGFFMGAGLYGAGKILSPAMPYIRATWAGVGGKLKQIGIVGAIDTAANEAMKDVGKLLSRGHVANSLEKVGFVKEINPETGNIRYVHPITKVVTDPNSFGPKTSFEYVASNGERQAAGQFFEQEGKFFDYEVGDGARHSKYEVSPEERAALDTRIASDRTMPEQDRFLDTSRGGNNDFDSFDSPFIAHVDNAGNVTKGGALIERLKTDPEFAAEYRKAVEDRGFEIGDSELPLVTRRENEAAFEMAKAHSEQQRNLDMVEGFLEGVRKQLKEDGIPTSEANRYLDELLNPEGVEQLKVMNENINSQVTKRPSEEQAAAAIESSDFAKNSLKSLEDWWACSIGKILG